MPKDMVAFVMPTHVTEKDTKGIYMWKITISVPTEKGKANETNNL